MFMPPSIRPSVTYTHNRRGVDQRRRHYPINSRACPACSDGATSSAIFCLRIVAFDARTEVTPALLMVKPLEIGARS